MRIEDHLSVLYHRIPDYIYLGCLGLLLLCVVAVIILGGLSKRWRIISRLLMFEYVFLIYCSTVVFRSCQGNYRLKLVPFRGLLDNGYLSGTESLLNVIMFMPLGFLFGMAGEGVRWWKVLIICFSISVSVEVLQYIMQRGFSETDDVIRNTAGCMIGYGIYRFVSYLAEKWRHTKHSYKLQTIL